MASVADVGAHRLDELLDDGAVRPLVVERLLAGFASILQVRTLLAHALTTELVVVNVGPAGQHWSREQPIPTIQECSDGTPVPGSFRPERVWAPVNDLPDA